MELIKSAVEWLVDNFANISGWCSVLGLAISLIVLSSLKRIRKHFQLKARTPEIIEQLDEYSAGLNSYTDDIGTYKNEIITISKQLEQTLNSLRTNADSNMIKYIDKMMTRIKKLKSGGPIINIPIKGLNWSFENETWEIYSDLQGVLQGIKETSKDSRWGEQ